jgi:hypothetical protein
MSRDRFRAAVMVVMHTLCRLFIRIPIRYYLPIGLAAMNGGGWVLLITLRGRLQLFDVVTVLVINAGLGLAGGTVYGLLRGALAVLDRRVSNLRLAQHQQAAAMDFVLSAPGRPSGRAETYQ